MSKIVEVIKGERKVPIEIGYLAGPEFDTVITWNIYKRKHKFLWKTWYTYDYDMTVPYITKRESMQSAREIASNERLQVVSREEKSKIYRKMTELQMKDNGYV